MTAGTDPERMLSSGTTPASLRTALRSAKGDVPDARELQALATALTPQLGPGGAGGGGGAGGASGLKASLHGLRWLVAAGVVATGVGLVVTLRTPSAPSLVVAPEPTGADTAPVAEPERVEAPSPDPPSEQESSPVDTAPAPTSAKAQTASRAAARPTASQGTREDRAAQPSEAALLDSARKALQGDPRKALAYTETHRALYPRGLLAQEREVIAIEALRKLGDRAGAQQRNREFEARYPDTIHGREIETAADGGKK